MQETRTTAQEAAEDIFFGQSVIVWARWFVILAATILVLFTTNDLYEMIGAVLLVVPLIAINFYVHGRYMMEKPANRLLLLVLSLLDLVIIGLIVLVWQSEKGLYSPFFIFFYPVLLAFAFVFPIRLSAIYTALALMTFAGASVASEMVGGSFSWSSSDFEQLVIRLITMAATAVLAMFYYRIQRARRRETGEPGVLPA
jgi:hypothetical protein